MRRLDLIAPAFAPHGQKHLPRAVAASLLLHGIAFGSVVALALAFHSQLESKSGSLSGAPTVALEKMMIIPPPKPMPPPLEPAPPAIANLVIPPASPQDAVILLKPPGIPVLAATFPAHAFEPRLPAHATEPAAHHHASSAVAASAVADTPTPASYAPGPNDFPHPPYPDEARDMGETGTVLVHVVFDGSGNVARADIVQTSGVAVLDCTTRAYIRRHWHSTAYERRAVSVPVEYTLQPM